MFDDGPPDIRNTAPERDFFVVPISLFHQRMTARIDSLLTIVGPDAWIAGGAVRDFIRGDTPKDYDVYFANEAARAAGMRALLARGYEVTNRLPIVTTVQGELGKIDIISRDSDGPLATIRSFDFVACCGAVSKTAFAYHASFAIDAKHKVLRLNALPNPGPSVKRALRFIAQGWTMSADVARVLAERGEQVGPDWSGPDGMLSETEYEARKQEQRGCCARLVEWCKGEVK